MITKNIINYKLQSYYIIWLIIRFLFLFFFILCSQYYGAIHHYCPTLPHSEPASSLLTPTIFVSSSILYIHFFFGLTLLSFLLNECAQPLSLYPSHLSSYNLTEPSRPIHPHCVFNWRHSYTTPIMKLFTPQS